MNKLTHFINLDDFSRNEIKLIIDNAIQLKSQLKNNQINNKLENRTLAMIFDKASTRTRVSFETGMNQLGGKAIFLSNNDTQLGRGEIISDSAKVISSMVDIIMLRVSSHQDIIEFATHSTKPVINALSDESHPCQLLADIMSFIEVKGDISGKTLAWIGDGNNMANTYAQAAKLFDFTLNIATPQGYEINDKFLNSNVQVFDNPQDACTEVDAIVTDVFTSMGQENEQQQRLIDFKAYQVTPELMNYAKNDVIFMHCLPAHRGEEVTAEVIDGKQSIVFREAENRLHAQKALMLYLLGKI
jgi:ornithine carbamoyltransferase